MSENATPTRKAPWWGKLGWGLVVFAAATWIVALVIGAGPGPQHFAILGVGAVLGVGGLVSARPSR